MMFWVGHDGVNVDGLKSVMMDADEEGCWTQHRKGAHIYRSTGLAYLLPVQMVWEASRDNLNP